MKVALLASLFFLTALLYASVGFGGGSTYTALLVLTGANYLIIPVISLVCNILVVSGNSWRYSRAGLISWARVWPFLVLSVPMAWIGGRIHVPKTVFIGLLALALLFAGLALLFKPKTKPNASATTSLPLSAAVGAGLGLLSGIVGIGGGIFLAPVLHRIGWGKAKEIAALCSLFILVNSVSGLTGQLIKLGGVQQLELTRPYWLLVPMVLIGGYIGNHMSVKLFSENTVRKMTAILVLFVAVRLLWKFSQLALS
ncbi:MAG: sulfoacetate transporter [Robiginitomaculum sp.]|nr:MAG: sulfoacetate transporter [Robiginitomaculum sp.]PHQ68042.1 MAG: sulfoacetate transporter [Robiginitomaculum sp.]